MDSKVYFENNLWTNCMCYGSLYDGIRDCDTKNTSKWTLNNKTEVLIVLTTLTLHESCLAEVADNLLAIH